MPRNLARLIAVLLALSLIAAACGDDDDGAAGDTGGDTTADTGGDAGTGGDTGGDTEGDTGGDTGGDGEIDYEAIGLWDDGPCDESLEPLRIGMITVFESPVLSLIDQARALEAAAEAFNQRGGANGACIEVHTCDDGANVDQAVACVRELDEAGVVVTVNDQVTAGQADVSAAFNEAGIPELAANVTSETWGDQNAFPLDASGSGVTFLMPQALVNSGVLKIGVIRVDTPSAGVLGQLLGDLYATKGAEIVVDVPVPGGTTDFSQFIFAAQDAGAGGVILALGEQEAVQVVRAAQQLDSDLMFGQSLGTFAWSNVKEFGDFAQNMTFVWPFPPATYDVPVYQALRADLAASGQEALQPENLKTSPMRSWIGLYALLYMLREDGSTEFTRESVKAIIEAARDVPMLGLFGDEDWTPDMDHPGLWQRAGVNRWAFWKWDPEAEWNGESGNFVLDSEVNFDEVLCGSPFGAPAEEC